jgi:exonuclease III
LYNTHVQRHWTPILEITRQFKIGKSTNVKVLRRQFPLRPAAAKTINRCQGDTLDEAVVDFPNSTREHMHYVGLSRVRNIDKLHILNLSENKIRVNPKVKEEMARLRSKCKLVPCVPDLTAVSYTKTLKILFHNVRSLHLHISDISNDFDVQATDISIFVETALCARDTDEEYKIDGFDLFRNDHIHLENNIRTTYGTITYLKSTLAYLVPPFSYNYNNMEISVTVVNEPVPNLHIVGIYRSRSKVKLHKLIEALDYLHMTLLVNKPTILLGDFNIDLLKPSSERKALMRNMIECRGYSQLISQFTTDNRTCIDHIYTNIPHVVHSSGTLESYFSDHKPIFVCLQLMH